MAPKPSFSSFFLLIFLVLVQWCGTYPIYGQSRQIQEQLANGIGYLGREEYEQAILTFRSVIIDSEAGPYKADAYFWLAKAYLATSKLEEAERSLESYISNYPDHPYFPEAMYQKGRLLFMQNDYESSIQVLQAFISGYPSSEFLSNAYFWTAEALYSLGHLDESALICRKIINEYPRSFKIEAAQYRLSLIEFKKRENELLKLLKWSHEEFLKTIEEFQRREKTYEQALAALQRKLLDLKKKGEDTDKISALLREIEKAQQENREMKDRLNNLQQNGSTSISASGEAAIDLEEKLRLVQLKEDALQLKESLLLQLQEASESQ